MKNKLYKTIGNRIRTSRESLGLSQEQLANQIGYSSSASISNFEAGSRKISIADLHKIAQVIGVSIEYFLTDLEAEPMMQTFRLRAHAINPSSRESVASFLSFASENGTQPTDLSEDFKNKRPGEAAWDLINLFNFKNLPVSPTAIATELKIPVFQWDFPNEISGLLAFDNEKACIGVNRAHPTVRQRFTIAHEIGHFVYDTDQEIFVDYSDVEVYAASEENQGQSEIRANQFAADLLMPYKWIYRDFEKYGVNNYERMVKDYQVSQQALWIRLVTLKLVPKTN